MNRLKFYIETFGCQMNVHDSEKIAGVLDREGHISAESPAESDIIILNTCSIRQKPEQKFFSELGRLKRLKRKKPNLKIAVAGCIAQQLGQKILSRAPYVDFIFGPQNIHRISEALKGDRPVIANEDNPIIADDDLPALRKEKGRAWVTIMYGCNNFCSYCIVPYTRGRERSRPSENIFREAQGLANEGYREINLLGQNVNSYRGDLDFPELLMKINSVSGLERIRFVTSHPRDLTEKLVSAMNSAEKVCEHIHLPLQSGSTSVLELMNRGYTFDDYRRKIDLLRETVNNISITTDIITGFPGETAEDHMKTVFALKDIQFDGIYAFKYSSRPGTKAASMKPHIPDEISSSRLLEILEVQDDISSHINNKLRNSFLDVLVEDSGEFNEEMLAARTRTNKIVHFPGPSTLVGKTVSVKIIEAKRHSLRGELL